MGSLTVLYKQVAKTRVRFTRFVLFEVNTCHHLAFCLSNIKAPFETCLHFIMVAGMLREYCFVFFRDC